jgi:type IX secretion system PorP/SprF family membrane protein
MNNKYMRKVVSCLFLISFLKLHAQFDAQLSQYMLHPTGFNPAAVGESGMLDVSGQHRLHWVGMPNGGSTTVFNINTPFKIAGKQQGVGISFINDNVGLFINRTFHVQYAYKIKIGEAALNIGPGLGFVSVGFKGDSVRGPQVQIGDYHDINTDPAIPTTLIEGMNLDIDVGTWFTYKGFYAGVSYSHLNQPVVEWDETHEFSPASSLFVTSGYNFTWKNPKYVFKPSMLVKTDFSAFQLDLSTLVEYNNQYWGGLSYRWSDAVVFLAGIHIGNGITIGYSFDLPVSHMIKASWGSHEIMLSYVFDIKSGDSSRRKKYKSIRIL